MEYSPFAIIRAEARVSDAPSLDQLSSTAIASLLENQSVAQYHHCCGNLPLLSRYSKATGPTMRQINPTLALTIVLAAAGCATEEKYVAQTQAWMGRPEKELLATWGAPNRAYETAGTRYLTYARLSLITTGGYYDRWDSWYGSPARTMSLSCETTFVVANGIVQSVSHRGNDCRAS
jgi:hypothetical protein